MSLIDWLLGLFVGLALGLTGGGGMLAVPALVLGLDYSMQEARPAALMAISVAASVGALEGFRKKIVRYKAAVVMSLAGIGSAPLGIRLSESVPADALIYAFGALLLFVSLKTVFEAIFSSRAVVAAGDSRKLCRINPESGRFYWCPKSFLTLAGIGGASGVLTGMFGVGGGFLIVPSLRQHSDLGINSTVATSLAVIALVSGGTALLTLAEGVVISPDSLCFISSSIGGMVAARVFAARLPDFYLQLGFALITFFAAALMIYQQSTYGTGT